MRNGLVEGVSLRAVLRESGAMAPEAAASVLAGMLVTLAVVHGDVRPEHVRVDGSGGLALTDFGGAEAQFVPNSPTYLAPERLKGAAASAGSDVFSATAVFFECLTNESPFVAATRDDLAALHEYAEVIAEFAPPELRSVAQRGMAPDPARRPGSPHEFLDEVTTTATAAYGADWQQRGRALLGAWAVAAARAEGTELVAPPGPNEAPPVGEPIDEALLELGAQEPPPVGEPIDEALLGADDDEVFVEEPGAETPTAEASGEDDEDYDWFTGSGRAEAAPAEDVLGAEADVLAAFDDARAERVAEPEPDPYTPAGFDVFADRSGGAAEEDAADEPAEEGAASPSDDVPAAPVESLEAEPEVGESAVVAEPLESEPEANGEPEAAEAESADPESQPPVEDSSELLAAFDAFTPATTAEPEPEAPPPVAGLQLETLAATELLPKNPEPEAEETDSEPAEPEDTTPTAPTAATAATAPSVSSDTSDLEDDWVIPAKPSPRVPRSLSAFAVSLPSLPRPKEAEEPKPPVQTSAPDDWFRPGVPEPVGADAHHTQVLNPDRDNTVESEATRMLDEVPVEAAARTAEKAAAEAAEPDDADGYDDREPGGSGGPRRKTLVGAVTTAVLLVAGAAAVVLGGSGKSPEGTGGTPTESSTSAPSATAVPTTPTGTSNGAGDSSTESSTPSSHRSSTHSRSRSSSPSTTSHSSSDGGTTHSSSSSTPSDHGSSSTTPTSSTPTSPTGSCIPLIVSCPTPTSSSTKTPGN